MEDDILFPEKCKNLINATFLLLAVYIAVFCISMLFGRIFMFFAMFLVIIIFFLLNKYDNEYSSMILGRIEVFVRDDETGVARDYLPQFISQINLHAARIRVLVVVIAIFEFSCCAIPSIFIPFDLNFVLNIVMGAVLALNAIIAGKMVKTYVFGESGKKFFAFVNYAKRVDREDGD